MTRDEIIDKGNKQMRVYLNSMAGEMSMKTRRRLFKIIENNYRAKMEDDEYFADMESFLTRRKSAAERERFFKEKVTGLIGDVRETYAEMYPGDYRLMEETR